MTNNCIIYCSFIYIYIIYIYKQQRVYKCSEMSWTHDILGGGLHYVSLLYSFMPFKHWMMIQHDKHVGEEIPTNSGLVD